MEDPPTDWDDNEKCLSQPPPLPSPAITNYRVLISLTLPGGIEGSPMFPTLFLGNSPQPWGGGRSASRRWSPRPRACVASTSGPGSRGGGCSPESWGFKDCVALPVCPGVSQCVMCSYSWRVYPWSWSENTPSCIVGCADRWVLRW